MPSRTSERTAIAGTRGVDDPADQHLDTGECDLFLGWRFSDRVGVRAYVPLLYRSWHRVLGDGSVEDRWLGGAGDTQVEATWTAVRRGEGERVLVLTLFAGVQIPTGSDAQLGEHVHIASPFLTPADAGGHVHDGSTAATATVVGGVTPWCTVTTSRSAPVRGAASAASPHSLRAGVWFGTAHGDVIATATNADRYRCGPHAMWGGGPGAYLWRGARGRLGLQANCSGEWRDVDVQGGATVADTGRLVVCLGPDLSLVWGNGLSAELGVDLPVFRRADGEQLLPTWRTHAGVAYAW